MALPIYRDITYYRGDTFTERLYPKNSDGTPFSLTDTNNADFLAYFYIDTDRDGNSTLQGATDLNSTDSTITYTISPAVGIQLISGTSYTYEIKIKNQASGEIYTLVTGALSVSGNVKTV